MKGYSSILH